MDTQPKALWLANALQQQAVWEGHYGPSYLRDLLPEAAAELRRLQNQCDALLEALRALVQNEGLEPYSYLDKGIGTATAAGQRWLNARAVIAAAKG